MYATRAVDGLSHARDPVSSYDATALTERAKWLGRRGVVQRWIADAERAGCTDEIVDLLRLKVRVEQRLEQLNR